MGKGSVGKVVLLLFLVCDGSWSSALKVRPAGDPSFPLPDANAGNAGALTMLDAGGGGGDAVQFGNGYDHPICMLMYTEVVLMLFSLYLGAVELSAVTLALRAHREDKSMHEMRHMSVTQMKMIGRFMLPGSERETASLWVVFLIFTFLFLGIKYSIPASVMVTVTIIACLYIFGDFFLVVKHTLEHGKRMTEMMKHNDTAHHSEGHGGGHGGHGGGGHGGGGHGGGHGEDDCLNDPDTPDVDCARKSQKHRVDEHMVTYANMIGNGVTNMSLRLILVILSYFLVETFCYKGFEKTAEETKHDHDHSNNDDHDHSNNDDHDHSNDDDHDHSNDDDHHHATAVTLQTNTALATSVQGAGNPHTMWLLCGKTLGLVSSVAIFGFNQACHKVMHSFGHGNVLDVGRAAKEYGGVIERLHAGSRVESIIQVMEIFIALIEILFTAKPESLNGSNENTFKGVQTVTRILGVFFILLATAGAAWVFYKYNVVAVEMKNFDWNDDEVITKPEVKKSLETFYNIYMTDEEFDDAFERYDKDNSGTIDRHELEDLMKGVLKNRAHFVFKDKGGKMRRSSKKDWYIEN